MKQFYTSIVLILIALNTFSQSYDFALVHNSDYNFSVVAIPDFTDASTDISDMGFALMLPAGTADITNPTQFNGRPWTVTQITQEQFATIGGIDSGGRDGFAMNLPPGQTILSHTAGTSFVLVSFDASNMPTTGMLEILVNTDPIALALGGAIDSFYNSNIDGTTTQDYFGGIVPDMGNFDFATLGVPQEESPGAQVSMYPNPASDIVHIDTNLELTKVELYDVLGKRILHTGATNHLNIERFKAGIYFLKVYTTTGNVTKKLVIE